MVSLLFTDIVSSVPLKQRLGDKAGAALIQQQRALVSHLLTTCPGAEEIETAGEASSSKTGTYLYMAPELFAGKPASTRSDLYSLGVVLYQLLVGDLARPLITDGRALCTVGDDAAIGFWNVATGREMLRFDGICQSLVIYLEIFPHLSCDDRVLLFGPFVSEPGESGAPDPLWRYRVTTIPTLAEIDSAP